jgi:hypothetical protein
LITKYSTLTFENFNKATRIRPFLFFFFSFFFVYLVFLLNDRRSISWPCLALGTLPPLPFPSYTSPGFLPVVVALVRRLIW